MGMVFCRGCGKEIHETAHTCPQCGAPQGNLTSMKNPPYSSYDEVPVYRKNWFAILCSFIFFPAVIILLLTGDIYYESKGQLKIYSKGAKMFFYVLGLIMIASIIWGK
jgi:uncharacterized membrane protein YvbJ